MQVDGKTSPIEVSMPSSPDFERLANTMVSKRVALSQPRIEPALRQTLLRFAVLFSVPATAFITLVVWLGLVFHVFKPTWGSWVLDTVVTIGAALVVVFTWMMVHASTNFGVILQDGGVVVFEWGLGPRKVRVRFTTWEDVREPLVDWTGGAMKTAGGLWLMMDRLQLKALLSDSRCPLRGRISPKVAYRLGLISPD